VADGSSNLPRTFHFCHLAELSSQQQWKRIELFFDLRYTVQWCVHCTDRQPLIAASTMMIKIILYTPVKRNSAVLFLAKNTEILNSTDNRRSAISSHLIGSFILSDNLRSSSPDYLSLILCCYYALITNEQNNPGKDPDPFQRNFRLLDMDPDHLRELNKPGNVLLFKHLNNKQY
jgi:hypothetical protein